MDWDKKFTITNVGESIVLTGIIELRVGDSLVVDPSRQSEKTIDDLKIFERRGNIEVSDKIKEPTAKDADNGDIARKTTVNGANGDVHEHYVLDPHANQRGMQVENIDLGRGIITAEDLTTDNEGPITVTNNSKVEQNDKMTREEAINFVESHWKKFESEVGKITDVRKLNFLAVIAVEMNATDKKKEILEARIASL